MTERRLGRWVPACCADARPAAYLCGGGILAIIAATTAGAVPPLFDWEVRDLDDEPAGLIRLPAPGSYFTTADDPAYEQQFDTLYAAGLPLAFKLRDPWTNPADGLNPDALETILSYIPALDYVICDYESYSREADMSATIAQVRNHPDPEVREAFIGNWQYYPGPWNCSASAPFYAQRILADRYYMENDLRMAMPVGYPYSVFQMHTWPEIWGSGFGSCPASLAPNVRSALFWAPLEQVSLAMRLLPAGHITIPWVNSFIQVPDLPADPPPAVDNRAFILHLRLRGVHGYIGFHSGNPDYSDEQYRHDIFDAWHALDCIMEPPGSATVLNLETDKESGVQWSGVQRGSDEIFIISNLGDDPATVNLPNLPGVPDISPVVPAGQHRILIYDSGTPLACGSDCNGNGIPDSIDIALALGIGEADCNGNGVLDSCESGGDCDGNGTPDLCELDGNDCNANGVVDACDIAGGAPDCNGNGMPDSCDLSSGASSDANGNGVPDECDPPCNADLDGNGTVNVDDLVMVIVNWGSHGSPADVNGDNVVNVDDLVALISSWGACP